MNETTKYYDCTSWWSTAIYLIREECTVIMRFGFVKDENCSEFKNVFKNNTRLKEIYVDIYSENPLISSKSFMLLLRTSEKNIKVLNNDNRFVILKNDKFNTCLMDVLTSKISECFYVNNENYSEFILNIQNIYYKITVLN